MIVKPASDVANEESGIDVEPLIETVDLWVGLLASVG